VIRLFGIPGSHPTLAAELMLRHKGLPYRRVDMPNGSHRIVLRALGYDSRTVPVARIDGRKVAGTMAIARALDAVQPSPALLPDGDGRGDVERAEAWADAQLQEDVRAPARWAVMHDPAAMATFLDGVHMGLPPAVLRGSLPLLRPVVGLTLRVPDAEARPRLGALVGRDLDEVDRLLAEGVIGGPEPNAADFQVATSVRLALCFDDLRERIDARPAGAFARRLCPDYPGRFRSVLPPEWLA
jgi:glutathione S-transferase